MAMHLRQGGARQTERPLPPYYSSASYAPVVDRPLRSVGGAVFIVLPCTASIACAMRVTSGFSYCMELPSFPFACFEFNRCLAVSLHDPLQETAFKVEGTPRPERPGLATVHRTRRRWWIARGCRRDYCFSTYFPVSLRRRFQLLGFQASRRSWVITSFRNGLC